MPTAARVGDELAEVGLDAVVAAVVAAEVVAEVAAWPEDKVAVAVTVTVASCGSWESPARGGDADAAALRWLDRRRATIVSWFLSRRVHVAVMGGGGI